MSSINFIVLFYRTFCCDLKLLYSWCQIGWLDLSKKFYFDSLNANTNYFTSIVSLSIPSEFPVTDFKLGPKKTKNFFIFSVINKRSLSILTMYLHLSTSGLG